MVIMDVQMPRLDGLQATARIRALERDGDDGHVPIVAVTATLLSDQPPQPVAQAETLPLLDLGRLEGGLGLGPTEVSLLAGAFLEDLPGLIEPCAQALQVGNAQDLIRAAHTLKGVPLNLGVAALSQAACVLEEKVRAGDLAGQTREALSGWIRRQAGA